MKKKPARPQKRVVKQSGQVDEKLTFEYSPLSPKDARFVAEYLIDGNAAAAARRIGSTAKRAEQAGYEYLTKPDIAAAVQAGQAAQLQTAGVTKERLLEELGRLALVNVREYFDPVTKDAKLPSDLTDAQGACLAGFEVLIKNAKAGDGVTDTIHKFKLWDKVKAIELYMKHYGMLIEKLEVKDTTADARVARLVAARKRVAGK
jgi:phage terminase small subunit